MATTSFSQSISGAGENISQSVARSANSSDSRNVTLVASQPGTLTTRSSVSVGTVTMTNGGHGITTSQVVDLYWNGGMRYGVTVGTVSGTSVPFSGGAGDNLPGSTGGAIVVAARTAIGAMIDGNTLSLIGVIAVFVGQAALIDAGHIDCQDSGAATVAAVKLPPNTPIVSDVTGGAANPYTGNQILNVIASNGSSTVSMNLKMIWAQNS